ncbi:MAG: hypothetical protein P4L99_00225 [Chthoniobacter sp.]|nr:hypothetical protein [Chthoniobacter sp.]
MSKDGPNERRGHGLFLAGDPGGAAALLPVIQQWPKPTKVFAYRHALQMFRDAGLTVKSLDEMNATLAQAETLLRQEQPAFLCAATSANKVDWERYFFVASRRLGIPSVGLLDYWSNYAARFTLESKLDALPDTIAIMDERARAEMIADGFPAERLSITGQPVLDQVRRWHADLPAGSRSGFRARFGMSDEMRVFLFVSQPLREMRSTVGAATESSTDEFACLKQLLEAVDRVASPKLLLIKLHPRESADKYQALLSSVAFPTLTVELQQHRWELCLAADAVLGMDSMLLEEALAMGCAVERIRPGQPLSLSGSYHPPSTKTSPPATELIGRLPAFQG